MTTMHRSIGSCLRVRNTRRGAFLLLFICMLGCRERERRPLRTAPPTEALASSPLAAQGQETSTPTPKNAGPTEGPAERLPPGVTNAAPASAAAGAGRSSLRLAAVIGSLVNVRSGPGTDGNPIGRLQCGDVVTILDMPTDGDWYHIAVGELIGYAHSAYLIEVQPGKGRLPTCEFAHLKIKPPRASHKPETGQQIVAAKRSSARPPAGAAAPDQAVLKKPAAAASPAPRITEAKPATPAPPVTPAKATPVNVMLSMHGVKPSVSFPHLQHTQKFACAKCHHPADGSSPNKEKDCHKCHQPGGRGASQVANRDAFHQTCRACHEASGRGPTECKDCHSGQPRS